MVDMQAEQRETSERSARPHAGHKTETLAGGTARPGFPDPACAFRVPRGCVGGPCGRSTASATRHAIRRQKSIFLALDSVSAAFRPSDFVARLTRWIAAASSASHVLARPPRNAVLPGLARPARLCPGRSNAPATSRGHGAGASRGQKQTPPAPLSKKNERLRPPEASDVIREKPSAACDDTRCNTADVCVLFPFRSAGLNLFCARRNRHAARFNNRCSGDVDNGRFRLAETQAETHPKARVLRASSLLPVRSYPLPLPCLAGRSFPRQSAE